MTTRGYIAYRDGFQYQLVEDAEFQTSLRPKKWIRTKFVNLSPAGLLLLKEGFAWDGPSGPAMDTPASMYGSAPHDGTYRLMRFRLIARDQQKLADDDYKRFCLEAGMWEFRAWMHFNALRSFGGASTDPASERPILYAPRKPEGAT